MSLLAIQMNLLVYFRQVGYTIRCLHLRGLLYLCVDTAIQLGLKRLLEYCFVSSCLGMTRTKGPCSVSTRIIIVGVAERITLLVLLDEHLLLVFDHLNGRFYMVKGQGRKSLVTFAVLRLLIRCGIVVLLLFLKKVLF